jgi:hypothetical protein
MIGILFLIAGLGVAMAAIGSMWHTLAQREKERELLFIGEEFRQAIQSFWRAPAGGVPRLPKDFDELLSDPRFPNTVRHLRRVYRDPMSGETEWGVVKDVDGGITAVYSLSERAPYKTDNFPNGYEDFKTAKSYQDWVFFFDSGQKEEDKIAAGTGTVQPQPGQPQPGQPAKPKPSEPPEDLGGEDYLVEDKD